MKKSKRIPIQAAKDFANKYGKDQVIIISYDNDTDMTWVTTWGRNIEDCRLAAESGNNLKRHMGWPESACHATPVRLKKKGISL